MNRHCLPALVLTCLLTCLSGCGKPKTADATSPPSAPGADAASTSEAQASAKVVELTQLVRKFSVEQRQAPKSLDELVAKGYLASIPDAPKGKRFAINKSLQVYLADR